MKRLTSVALVSLLALVGCDNASRLDKVKGNPDQKAATAAGAGAAPEATDHSGTLEERVAKLEKNFDNYADALDFLQKVYDQQNQEPDPNAVFAVDIGPDIKAGQVEGSPEALVTIVEAWDFA